LRSNSSISPRQLRDFAMQTFPSYMVPQAILILQRMPLTPSGKIDRKALLAHEDLLSGRTQAYVAPGNPVQQTMAELWSELLNVEKVGIHDDFFEAGGHSLLATRLVSHIRRAFDVEIPLRSLFESPTISQISELVQSIKWASGRIESDLPPGEREEICL
jgi:acyl carrier protein